MFNSESSAGSQISFEHGNKLYDAVTGVDAVADGDSSIALSTPNFSSFSSSVFPSRMVGLFCCLVDLVLVNSYISTHKNHPIFKVIR